MKSRRSQDTLARSDDPLLHVLLAEVMDDHDRTIILIPEIQQPLEERSQAIAMILIYPSQDEIQGIQYDEFWSQCFDFPFQHIPMLLEIQIKSVVVQEFEREIVGKIEIH